MFMGGYGVLKLVFLKLKEFLVVVSFFGLFDMIYELEN